MKVGLATSQGRMAPCFAGVALRILEEDADLGDATVDSTQGWHPLLWGRELMRRDVGLLLCAGLDQGTWAAVQGHGIQVIPNAMGQADQVWAAWRSGALSVPPMWPAYPPAFGGPGAGRRGGGRRRRFHGGRW